ncbi:MAG: hypothetical protein QOG15_2384 [Solirubrobacteraceae bacterium]|nr:hypothetical protein [Solirubrobacteraceae bacterium]
MSAWPALAAAVAGVLGLSAAGCGTPSPDLFLVNRDGTVPGAKLTMLVSDTSVRCNHGSVHELTSAQTIEARELSKDLHEFQAKKPPIQAPRPAQIFSFAVRNDEGTVRYPDTAQRPTILPRITRFVRDTAIGTCGLKR